MAERVTIWFQSNPMPIEFECDEFKITRVEDPLHGSRPKDYELSPGWLLVWKSKDSQQLLWLEPSEIVAIRSVTDSHLGDEAKDRLSGPMPSPERGSRRGAAFDD